MFAKSSKTVHVCFKENSFTKLDIKEKVSINIVDKVNLADFRSAHMTVESKYYSVGCVLIKHLNDSETASRYFKLGTDRSGI